MKAHLLDQTTRATELHYVSNLEPGADTPEKTKLGFPEIQKGLCNSGRHSISPLELDRQTLWLRLRQAGRPSLEMADSVWRNSLFAVKEEVGG